MTGTDTTTQRPEGLLLVVDDEPNIRELLSASLRHAGFDVITAADGREALQLAERCRPDLVVLDVMLPDMNGFSVTKRLRESGFTAPILFLTAKDDTQDKVTGLTVGGDDYELLVTVPPAHRTAVESAAGLSFVGSVAEGEGLVLLGPEGPVEGLTGFEHA